nr:unnamed protein product [Callosobruchus chinensis]
MAKLLSTNTLPQQQAIPITTQQVAAAIHQVNAEQTAKRLVFLDDQNDGHGSNGSGNLESGGWKKFEYKRRSQNSTAVGTEEASTLKSSIKAVPSVTYTYYHVFNLHPTTLCENVIYFLKQDFPEFTCSLLISKYPEHYTSFEVGIYNSNVNSFLEPTRWDAGTKINRFKKNPPVTVADSRLSMTKGINLPSFI